VRAAAHSADWSIVVEDHRLTYRARARRRMQNGRGWSAPIAEHT